MRQTRTIKGITFVDEPWRGMDLAFYPDGKIKHGLLDDPVTIEGLPMCCEVAFYPSGRLMCGRLDAAVTLDSVEYYEYIYLFDDGRIRSSKLGRHTEFDGIRFHEDTYIDFDEKHNVIAGCIGSRAKGWEKGTFVRRAPDGTFVPSLENAVNRTWEKGRYGCSVNGGEVSAWTNDQFGGTGSSCTLRDFLQGTFNEAIQSELPFDEVWALVEEQHSLISDVRPVIRLIL